MDFIEVRIRKFKSLIKRKDIKSPQWFAMEIDILLHPDFFGITGDEFKIFVWILGVATKLNQDTIRVYPKLCAHQIGVSENAIFATIEKLKGKRLDVTDTSRARNACVTLQDKTVQDSTRQDRENTSYSSRSAYKQPETFAEFQDLFSESFESWLNLYDQDADFIHGELQKAWHYFFIDKTKKKSTTAKGWKKRMTSWLNRSWERSASFAAPKQVKSKSQQVSENNAKLWQEVEQEEANEQTGI